MRPSFLVIGAAKCATNSLRVYLGKHPDIFMHNGYELNFFNKDENFNKGYAWYEKFFDGAMGKKAIGEVSGWYTQKMLYPNTAKRIHDYDPRMKLIYTVGNPYTRVPALWLQDMSQGTYSYPFLNKAILKNRIRYIDYYNYWQQLSAYRQYFPDDQIFIVFAEDLYKNPDAVLKRCFAFLGLEPYEVLQDTDRVRHNVSEGKAIDRPFLYFMRKTPLYGHIVKLFDTRLRSYLKRLLFTGRISKKPRLKQKTLNVMISILGEDTKRFLKYYGKSEDFWDPRTVPIK